MSDPRLDQEHAAAVAVLNQLVTWQREHLTEGECGAAPLCIGPAALVAFDLSCSMGAYSPKVLVLAAVGEIRKLRDENGRLEGELGAALAELTTWEDAADTLGPVGVPVDPS